MCRSGRDLFTVRTRVRCSCRPVRPRPHSALVTFPPLPHRSVGIRKDTKVIIQVHNSFVKDQLVALDFGYCF